MNKKQRLYCAISGYEPNFPFTSARDDYYYDLIENKASFKDRINHLQRYSMEYCGELTGIDCADVDEALRKEGNQDDIYHIFESLR